jgi:SAM-dependent methyltransferase
MDICTIIASNYVAFARVLAESYRAHHPDARCWVLVIDDYPGRIDPAAEPFEVLTPGELGIERFDRMAALYSVLELSTAVKPWLLRYLLNERGCETLSYLDPDIEVHGRLDEIDSLLRAHGLVVTPHLTAPMPRDGRKPSETDILIAGSYNLGFIGLTPGPATDELLDWWGERLETDCVVAPERGYFVDQRWMDFAPGLVPDLAVLRDPGYNVAYWNLPSRQVRRAGDRYTVNGRPLRFFHYSGFDPGRRDQLSKHQDRILLSEEPALRELCGRYADRLLAAGHREAQSWTYTYDRLGDGTPIDAAVRAGCRAAVEAGELHGSPFTVEGARELIAWLNQPADVGAPSGVSRYLAALHASRPDLQRGFPDLAGSDGARFATWAHVFGRATLPIPPALLGEGGNGDGDLPPVGVNVAGYFGSVLGVGEAGRQVIAALQASGLSVATIGLNAERSQQDLALGPNAGGEAKFPVNLICVNADVLGAFADQAGPDFFEGRYSIGLWWWEVSTFPDRWLAAFDHVDEVWVGSQHVADALTPVSPVPVVKIRQPVAIPTPPALTREELGLPEGFLFLFSFDYNSVFERKNPLAVIEAFTRAFPAAEPGGPQLVIKSINHEQDESNHDRLRVATEGRDDVHLIDRYVSREERDALTAACDCYVSLHRSEGFGFTVAEAMALGRPVIATDYSGTRELVTPANGYPVPFRLVPIGVGADPYPPEGEWAEPDVDHAAALMRSVVEDPQEARRRGERARADIAERHSHQAAGRVMNERLARVLVRGARLRRGRGAGALDTTRLRDFVAKGPIPPRAPRFGKPQVAARNALLRGLKPYAVHERMIDSEVVSSLELLDRSMQSLAASTGARIDDLVGQVDQLRQGVDRALTFMQSFGLDGGAPADEALALGDFPPAPKVPWTPEYVESHRQFVCRALEDPVLLNVFNRHGPLPEGYGVGYDERVVEYPWVLTRGLSGRVLDAGSTLNHPHVLIRMRPRVDELHIATLAPENQSFPFLDISYVFADLRDLPMRDGVYDHVICVSTLEHVGMDNSQYGDDSPRSARPMDDVVAAMGELRRVLRPGGVLYVTVPYGVPEDFGWQQVFDAGRLGQLVAAFGPIAEERRGFYRYSESGWQRSTATAAAGAQYRDHFSATGLAPDRAVAARAVACLELRR